MRESPRAVAIIGTGPAGLMAAHVLASAGLRVCVFEKRKAAGRKLLIAGSSGLNITYEAPIDQFARFYGTSSERMLPILQAFSPERWREFLHSLGFPTFKGTSRRYFIQDMKAAELLKAWTQDLQKKGAELRFEKECAGFATREGGGVLLRFADGTEENFAAACFCLGGGSWEPEEKPLRWPEIFKSKGIAFEEFRASNVGYQVQWPKELLSEAEGKPIKNCVLTSSRGSRAGDLVITRYGLEGTPVYFAGEKGTIHLDLKPDITVEQIMDKLRAVKENLSPMRRVKKILNLSPGALALAFHMTPNDVKQDVEKLAQRLKKFPLVLEAPQPLDEAISSSGGVSWEELNEDLMLKRFPGVYLAGEMIAWDAPTGGFLIQACVSQGYVAARAILLRRS